MLRVFAPLALLSVLLALPAQACHPAAAFSLVTPQVSQVQAAAYFAPPVASVGYLAAPLPLNYAAPVAVAAPVYSAPLLASPVYGAGYGVGLGLGVRSRVFVGRGFGLGGVRVRIR